MLRVFVFRYGVALVGRVPHEDRISAKEFFARVVQQNVMLQAIIFGVRALERVAANQQPEHEHRERKSVGGGVGCLAQDDFGRHVVRRALNRLLARRADVVVVDYLDVAAFRVEKNVALVYVFITEPVTQVQSFKEVREIFYDIAYGEGRRINSVLAPSFFQRHVVFQVDKLHDVAERIARVVDYRYRHDDAVQVVAGVVFYRADFNQVLDIAANVFGVVPVVFAGVKFL